MDMQEDIMAGKPRPTAKQQYDEYTEGEAIADPIEALRFFCAQAMTGQDWIDVEPFIDAISTERAALSLVGKVEKQEPVAFRIETGYEQPFYMYSNTLPTRGKWGALYTAPRPCPECDEKQSAIDVWEGRYADKTAECEKLKAGGMVLVTKEDAENYCRILTLLGMEEEGSPTEGVERLLSLHEGMVCADCQDTGWLENREEGKYPCTCMTEAEPYQLLEAERDELKNDLADMLDAKNGIGPTALSTVISQRDELAAQNRQMLEAIENVKEEAWLCCSHQRASRLCEALALPDLSTGILNRVRAEALRKAAELVIDLGDDSSTLDARTLTVVANAIRALGAGI